MTTSNFLNPLNSTKLISLDCYLDDMISLYNSHKFPKVLLLNGKKGIGKFTLVVHFLNYIFSQNETNTYDYKNKQINTSSIFYNQLLNKTNQDVFLIQAEENKNIKIDDIRALKSTLSRSSLSNNPRFIIIDEVEFINENSMNALLKTLEEPSNNNFFILINNQQVDILKTITSRCLKNNISLSQNEINNVINYLIGIQKMENYIDYNNNLTPGTFIKFNEICAKNKIDINDDIIIKIQKLLISYKKNKNRDLISLVLFTIDQFFLTLVYEKTSKLDFLLNTKSNIIKQINDFIHYNLNINAVLNSIEIKLKNV
jgi:DNA polymerase-3 subunit delta'